MSTAISRVRTARFVWSLLLPLLSRAAGAQPAYMVRDLAPGASQSSNSEPGARVRCA